MATKTPGAACYKRGMRGHYALALTLVSACRGGAGDGGPGGSTTVDASSGPTSTGAATSDASGSTAADSSSTGDTGEPQGPWQPGTVYPSLPEPSPRGLLDLRGLMHTHSVYSHDACDEMPTDPDGESNRECFEDLRRALCQTRHDFVMFTDHPDRFADNEYPDTLLYDPDRGDALLERDGQPVGNWSGCDAAAPVLLLAGSEGATMPVGLEHHADDRGDYGLVTPEAIMALKAAGAVSLVAHTEDWSVEQLETLPLDGFEMFNLHANVLLNLPAVAELLAKLAAGGEGLPHSDLAIMPMWSEDPRYLERWGSVLAHDVRRVTTVGTDAHRNTFMQVLPDGERVDSFRRMMQWFSNHLLVEPAADGSWDDRALKEALRARRLYAAFEYMGYPEGFDAHVQSAAGIVEIGGEVSLADAPTIHATAPSVRELDPGVTAPEISLHVMRAIEGGFEEVHDGVDTIDYVPDAPGAYRIEVRIVPHHLAGWLGDYVALADAPRPWIYANAFFVRP